MIVTLTDRLWIGKVILFALKCKDANGEGVGMRRNVKYRSC